MYFAWSLGNFIFGKPPVIECGKVVQYLLLFSQYMKYLSQCNCLGHARQPCNEVEDIFA